MVDVGTMTTYVMELQIFLRSESVLSEVKVRGWRTINEELLRSWMAHTWAMQTQQSGGARESFLNMTGEEVLAWIQTQHIGEAESLALLNEFRSLQQGDKEMPVWYLARSRALVQKARLMGNPRSDADALGDIKAGGSDKTKKIIRKTPQQSQQDLDVYLKQLVVTLASDNGISMMEVEKQCQAFHITHKGNGVTPLQLRPPALGPTQMDVDSVSGPITCYNCKRPGHIARNCTGNSKPPVCYTCGKPGHLARSCAAPPPSQATRSMTNQNNAKPAAPPKPCFKCGTFHWAEVTPCPSGPAQSFPNRPQQARPRQPYKPCNRCGTRHWGDTTPCPTSVNSATENDRAPLPARGDE
jgi:hypothetical protein